MDAAPSVTVSVPDGERALTGSVVGGCTPLLRLGIVSSVCLVVVFAVVLRSLPIRSVP